MKPTIRPINTSFKIFTIAEIDEVLEIERIAYSTPWSRNKFVDSLDNTNTLMRLIMHQGRVLGYYVALCSSDSADLLNICIHPERQQQGLGRALFVDLSQQLLKLHINSIFIEVRVSNLVALSFYQKLGFEPIDQRKKYYCDGEDAKILRLKIK